MYDDRCTTACEVNDVPRADRERDVSEVHVRLKELQGLLQEGGAGIHHLGERLEFVRRPRRSNAEDARREGEKPSSNPDRSPLMQAIDHLIAAAQQNIDATKRIIEQVEI